jgi:hypothetical protein
MSLLRVAAMAVIIAVAIGVCAPQPVWGDAQRQLSREPTFLHGLAQVIKGVVWELPKTTVDATLDGPPIAGTVIGLLAGAAAAVRTTWAGLHEMITVFDPWSTK